MIKVVCNSSPIIALSIISKLDLLWELFDVYITSEVYNEITDNDNLNDFGRNELIEAVNNKHIKVYDIKDKEIINKLFGHFHKGELETIFAAKELGIKIVLIDEKSARTFAESLLLKPLGVLGILERAKELGKIDKAKSLIDTLRTNNFRISDSLYEKLLAKLNEC
jgi:predicted nucleic acid-binding protein